MLKTLYPGKDGFDKVNSFVLEDLPSLEVVAFGSYSFSSSDSYQRSGSELKIVNCPKLVSVTAYSYAFQDFQKLVMTNLTSLQTITTSSYSFRLLSTIRLSGNRSNTKVIL